MKVVHPGETGQAVGCNARSHDRRIARMNIHKNARLTVQGRLLLVRRVEELGWRMVEAAKAAGISHRQGYRWLARYRSGGSTELSDRSSAPGCCKHRVAAERISEISGLRGQRLSGPTIARQLGMPVSTVGAILRRLGLGKLAMLEPKPAVVRYERQWPGELIHLDSKKLGRIAGIGHRITGRTGGTVNRHHGIGWEALHVCIDDATRLGYSEILPDERKESAVGFLERALGWLAQHGVTVERVMTDNGSAYLSQDFGAAVAAAGLKHKRTRPYTPRTNGKAERFIQTSLREWVYARPYATSQERTAALAPWLDHYNTARPHAALGYGPPAARLHQLQLLCSTEGTVASSRPASINDRCGGPGQGSPKATGGSRRAASCVSDMSDSSGGASPLCNLMEVKH
jgi:transposase